MKFILTLIFVSCGIIYQHQVKAGVTFEQKLDGVVSSRYEVGDNGTNVIISAPHGGSTQPSSIPDRDFGCYVNSECVWSHTCGTVDEANCKAKIFKDSYTKEIAIALADKLRTKTGMRPHLVINEIHRSKMDGNREINEATFSETDAVSVYNGFHLFLQQAKDNVNGRGLFLDIHGQTHSEGWIELGYMVTKDRLNNNNPLPQYSSIKYLNSVSSDSFVDILRGSNSLGKFLQDEGYNTIPSPTNQSPGTGGNYYSGGENTKVYGSKVNGMIDAIQVEIHKDYRNSENADAFAEALASAVNNFLNAYY